MTPSPQAEEACGAPISGFANCLRPMGHEGRHSVSNATVTYEDTYCADLKRERDAREAELVEVRAELRELQEAVKAALELEQSFVHKDGAHTLTVNALKAALAASSEEPGSAVRP